MSVKDQAETIRVARFCVRHPRGLASLWTCERSQVQQLVAAGWSITRIRALKVPACFEPAETGADIVPVRLGEDVSLEERRAEEEA